MTASDSEIAAEKVARFVGRFEPSYLLLACHAALPLILTPELLNYLRNHFLRGQVPWVAEADLLLSDLCRPVGYEQFAMAPDVRAYLIGLLRQQHSEVPTQVARLLIRYVRQLSQTKAPFSREELETEQLSAMVYLDERRGEAAQQLALSFRAQLLPDPSHYASNAELTRLVRLTQELAPQLGEYPELLAYAQDVSRLLAGDKGVAGLAEVRRRGVEAVVEVAGVVLPGLALQSQSGLAKPAKGLGADSQNLSGTNWRPLKKGLRGQDVRQLQEKLGLAADGMFGPTTENAVKAWQKLHGLVADGIVGKATWGKLFASQPNVGDALASPALPSFPPKIQRLLDEINDPATKPPRRLAIGDELEKLGDPRRGVGLDRDGLPDIDWVKIPGGPFIYRNGEKRELPTFWISRYPVTNRQFQAFINAGGYKKGKKARQRLDKPTGQDGDWWQGLEQPEPEKSRWPAGNRPRTDVDWHEAVAFTRWLTAARGLPEGTIRLPTEQEWEKAARGVDGLVYPWGNEYRSGFANIDETWDKRGAWYLEQTTAVGLYPQGRSPYGVEDMAGTVWEWCLDKYGKPGETTIDAGNDPRVLRGGSWIGSSDIACAAARLDSRPVNRYDFLGFRVVSSIQSQSGFATPTGTFADRGEAQNAGDGVANLVMPGLSSTESHPIPQSKQNSPICPKCHKQGRCQHNGDVGVAFRIWDEYVFDCPHCGYHDSQQVDGGESPWSDHFTQCPYCGEYGP